MKRFFTRNIDHHGRLFRGIFAFVLLIGAAFAWIASIWLSVILLLSGAFVAFEAMRGWCFLRACGIKTKY